MKFDKTEKLSGPQGIFFCCFKSSDRSSFVRPVPLDLRPSWHRITSWAHWKKKKEIYIKESLTNPYLEILFVLKCLETTSWCKLRFKLLFILWEKYFMYSKPSGLLIIRYTSKFLYAFIVRIKSYLNNFFLLQLYFLYIFNGTKNNYFMWLGKHLLKKYMPSLLTCLCLKKFYLKLSYWLC